MVDNFFDCFNVRNITDHIIKGKPFLKPYYSIDDARFEQLDEYTQYFKLWKESIEERNDASYTENTIYQMFISWQCYKELQITVFRFKEICKILLKHGVPYILSEKFLQDNVENCIGKQRAIGRGSNRQCDNVTIQQFEAMTNENFYLFLIGIHFLQN